MKITEARVRALIAELVDDNPFACRALLQIVAVAFTAEVPTAAVTCEDAPRLLLNPEFIAAHCRSDAHVKALVCHEFLHVLLRHTERRGPQSAAEHLALDAVINAIIHRALGPEYSSFMSRYYRRAQGLARLLRPPGEGEIWRGTSRAVPSAEQQLLAAWNALYCGRLVADDVYALALDLAQHGSALPAEGWLGDHSPKGAHGVEAELPPAVAEALDRALKSMNGAGIWRAPHGRGVGADAYAAHVRASEKAVERWRREAWRVLRRHLLPDPRSPRTREEASEYRLPVLSTADRRSFARALWSPLLPEAAWSTHRRVAGGSAQVYLDVSGSMNAELPLIIALLARLGRNVRRPFWAFSNVVAPALIRDGHLIADTTGGTSMSCVLEHLARTRPRAAVVVTDGYIETLDPALVRAVAGVRLHALVTRDGSTAQLERARVPFTQLGRLPQ